MNMSAFGRRFTAGAGILSLMDDLGRALAGGSGQKMLGGGNPAHIPAVQECFRHEMEKIMASPGVFERMIGNYTGPQGQTEFVAALAAMLKREYGWELGPENIALTNGSQTAFFYLFNLFGGTGADGKFRKILLPLAPEYLGYADLGLEDDIFTSCRPKIEFIDDVTFKYHIDFDRLQVGDDIGAICVSRPTNPTGNVLTDDEVEKLSALARRHDVPLIIDNAYGTPFPNIIFTPARPFLDDHVILSMSLSKLGLPGTRTGIVIAVPEVIRAIASMNAIFNLAPGSVGTAIAAELLRDGEIIRISRDVIRPYYLEKSQRAFAQLRQHLVGLDCFIHKPEGALFLWLWMRGLPIRAEELYERLKQRGVIVVSGHYFFPGLGDDDWRHRHECLRITFAQDESVVETGLRIIGEEVRRAYREG